MNVWDTFTHEGGHVVNNETGDVACDSYHKYKEDVQLMKSIGVSEQAKVQPQANTPPENMIES